MHSSMPQESKPLPGASGKHLSSALDRLPEQQNDLFSLLQMHKLVVDLS